MYSRKKIDNKIFVGVHIFLSLPGLLSIADTFMIWLGSRPYLLFSSQHGHQGVCLKIVP